MRCSQGGSLLLVGIRHALAAGITRGFLTAAGIALAALVIAVVTIRVRREDMVGAATAAPAESAGAEPTLEQAHL